MNIWLVVWIFFIFPYIGNNHPNWVSYISEGLKPPTRYDYQLVSQNRTILQKIVSLVPLIVSQQCSWSKLHIIVKFLIISISYDSPYYIPLIISGQYDHNMSYDRDYNNSQPPEGVRNVVKPRRPGHTPSPMFWFMLCEFGYTITLW
jgi:hypothetical protein